MMRNGDGRIWYIALAAVLIFPVHQVKFPKRISP